jgi:hypothetical protein
MKIQNYVNHLNTKPTHVRERHMYLWTLVGTFLVMVIWVAHMGREFSPNGTAGTVAITTENTKPKTISPFSAISSNLKNAFQNSKATAIGAFDSNGMSIEAGNKDLKVIDLEVVNQ